MLFSLITINYNNAKHLGKTLESVRDQTYTDYEYIIIDGGSTDGSVEIIRDFQKHFLESRYRYISEKDNGISDAMNKGLKLAKGDLIGIINSGDYYHKDALSIVKEEYANKPFDLFYGDTIKVTEDDSFYSYTKAIAWKNLYIGLPFMHSSCFIPKRVYERIGGFSEEYKIAMDIDILFKVGYNFSRVGYANKLISYQRIGGISHQKAIKGMEEYKTIALKYYPDDRLFIYLNYYLRIVRYYVVKLLKIMGLRTMMKALINK